jgi:peptidoglycan/xylan/chitin deacetylase (PgdA/CDA1 family)
MIYILKKIIRRLIANYYVSFGYISRAKKKISNNNYIVSIYFHNPTLKTFNDCIQWLIENNFEFLDAKQILTFNTIPRTSQKIPVIITVDDGWRENLINIVPIAHYNQIPVTIFITTEPLIDGGGYWWSYIKTGIKKGLTYCTVPFLKTIPNVNRLSILNHIKTLVHLRRESMTVSELKNVSISPFIQFGSHTVSHPILSNCSDDEANYEILQSKLTLDRLLPAKVISFSYPNGDFTERDVKLLKKHGYKLAFTTKPAMIKFDKKIDMFRLPRYEVLDNASLNENICRMTGIWFK